MDQSKSVADVCAERGMSVPELAAQSGLDESRALAIVSGRWTPSPAERDAIARVLGVSRDQLVWGHVTPIQHIYGNGPA
jgi:transcriptional regulator with XRE-family HTH domain